MVITLYSQAQTTGWIEVAKSLAFLLSDLEILTSLLAVISENSSC